MTLWDTERHNTGLCTIEMTGRVPVATGPNPTPWMIGPTLNGYTKAMATASDVPGKWDDTIPTNIRYGVDRLPRSLFDIVPMIPIGTTPTWCFTLLIPQIERPLPGVTQRFLRGLLDITYHSMRIRNLSECKDTSAHAEVIAQMSLAPTRHLLYVLDTSKREGDETVSTDEWNTLGHCHRGDAMGYDCEDGSYLAIEILDLIRNAPDLTDPELVELQILAQRYVCLFCVGVIQLDEHAYTYHAFGLMLDKKTIESFVYGGGGTQKAATLLPPVLLETTNYCTSCIAYTKDHGPVSPKAYTDGHIRAPVEANTLIGASLLRSQNIYRHILHMHGPDLFREYQCARICFAQNGALGAMINDLIGITSGSYETLPVPIPSDFVPEKFFDCWPRLASVASDSPEMGIIAIQYRPTTTTSVPDSDPVYDLCYRFEDWDEAAVMKATTPRIAQIAILGLPDHSRGVRVRIWH